MPPPETHARLRYARYLLLAGTALSGVPVAAGDLPTGGSVAHGSATITTPAPKSMAINQTSKRAVVNWQGFSVGQGARVDITQPSASSAILNRVTGSTPSSIAGQLNANGRVYLVNPNGIVIGKGGAVRTGGGFVASTLGIRDDDFMAGRNEFAGNGRSAAIINRGTI
jgi:filamentous hemagglutinin family protein